MVACNQKPADVAGTSDFIQQQVQPAIDTAGLASYNAWKAQHELADIQQYQAIQEAPAPVKKAVAKKTTPVRKATPAPKPVYQAPADNSVASNDAGNGSGAVNNEPSQTAEKKEGWSKAAKGAVIGGVAGAAGGAVINKKNRVVGAVIGAVIGAGGGYVVGRKMDKNDGRIE